MFICLVRSPVAQAGLGFEDILELTIFLLSAPKEWGYMNGTPSLFSFYIVLRTEVTAVCTVGRHSISLATSSAPFVNIFFMLAYMVWALS